MTQALNQQARESGQGALPLLAAILVSVALACMAPRATNILLPLTALACLWTARGSFAQPFALSRLIRDPLLIASLLLIGYLFLSAAFALDRTASMKQALVVTVMLALTWIGTTAAGRLGEQTTGRAAHALIWGMTLASLFLTIELLSDQAIARFVHNLIPYLRPDSNKDFTLENGRVVGIQLFELNRNLALHALFLWPAVFLAWTRLAGVSRIVALTALTAASVSSILFSTHETSKLACVASGIVFVLSLVSRTLVRRAIIALWCAGFLIAIPLAGYLYNSAQLHKASWLPTSAQARIIIWGYTAEKAVENPILGIGMRSTRLLDKQLAPTAEWPKDYPYPRRLGRHSHNLFMQSWLELGLAGVIIVMTAGALLFARIARLPESIQPAATAFATVFIIIAGFAWGMWQSWLVAGYGLALILLGLAARAAGEMHRHG